MTISEFENISSLSPSLLDFLKYFGDEETCLKLIFNFKYDLGFKMCPKCGADPLDHYRRVKNRRAYQCVKCSYQYYPTVGSIFEKSRVPLDKYFFVLYYMCISSRNMSAMQMKKNLGVKAYESMHSIMMNARFAIPQKYNTKLSGIVEIDEAFLGKGTVNFGWPNWSISTRKQPLFGMKCRDNDEIRVFLVNDRSKETLYKILFDNVELGSTIYSDGHAAYKDLSLYFEDHDWVNHSKYEFARGDVWTNGIEGFWGIFKRTIRGAHVGIRKKYVQQYLDECVWKYNNRKLNDMERFRVLLLNSLTTKKGHTELTRKTNGN